MASECILNAMESVNALSVLIWTYFRHLTKKNVNRKCKKKTTYFWILGLIYTEMYRLRSVFGPKPHPHVPLVFPPQKPHCFGLIKQLQQCVLSSYHCLSPYEVEYDIRI